MPSDAPNAAATTEDFEFDALEATPNYRNALIQEFRSALRGNVLEVGAGIGQLTSLLRQLPQISRILSVEPHSPFAARFREKHPAAELVEGTVEQTPSGTDWDAILSVNVLEHIHADELELARYASLLSARHGALCLFVPARPEIYAPIDKDFGHFRRYTRSELQRKLQSAGFKLERLTYYNCVGYFAWWLNFCILKKRDFELSKVRLFDSLIFPVVHTLESTLIRPPFGQSLLAIARAA